MFSIFERTNVIERDLNFLENKHAVLNFTENTTNTPYYLQPYLRNGGTFEICLEIFNKLK